MFGIVIVSHSRSLARSLSGLAKELSGKNIPIAFAGGVEGSDESFGTDAMDIMDAIESVYSDRGVVVFADMGSALLSTETALDFMDPGKAENIHISSAPLVEGVISAAVQCGINAPMETAVSEAKGSLSQKIEFLEDRNPNYAGEDEESEVFKGSGFQASSGKYSGKKKYRLNNQHGLHARPAARFIKTVSGSGCLVEVSNLTGGRGPVNGLSFNRLSSLEVQEGDEILVAAKGEVDAVESLFSRLSSLLDSNFDYEQAAVDPISEDSVRDPNPDEDGIVILSEGIGLGRAYLSEKLSLEYPPELAYDRNIEIGKLESAIMEVKSEMRDIIARNRIRFSNDELEIMETHILLLDDPDLKDESIKKIEDEKLTAASAWSASSRAVVSRFEKLKDSYLRARGTDVKDAASKVLMKLVELKKAETGTTREEIPSGSVVVAEKLTPSQVLEFDPEKINGILVSDSSTSTHSAILLKSLGIPAMGGAGLVSCIKEGQFLGLDAITGNIFTEPDRKTLERLSEDKERHERKISELRRSALKSAVTTDGKMVKVYANIASPVEAVSAIKNGADGIGLLRTEFMFLGKDYAPAEDEQYVFFRSVFSELKGKLVTVRTFDLGGDKQIPWLDLLHEDNPFLGLRGVRIYAEHTDLIKSHLRAILKAGYGNNIRIMLPMISHPNEYKSASDLIKVIHRELEGQNIPHIWPVDLGIMIETPASVIMADDFADICDFFSIGTNDLTQYILAAERGHPGLQGFFHAGDPAILRAVGLTVEAAEKAGIEVSLCGELAGDEKAVPALLELGVQGLSVNPSRIPVIKEAVRKACFGQSDQKH